MHARTPHVFSTGSATWIPPCQLERRPADSGTARTSSGAVGVIGPLCEQIAHGRPVTSDAVLLEHPRVALPEMDRLVEILEREGPRMGITVLELGEVLPDELVWNVAVVTGGDGVVPGLRRAIVRLAHDVAIGAGARVLREVRRPLCVVERVAARADEDAEQRDEQEPARSWPVQGSCWRGVGAPCLLGRRSCLGTAFLLVGSGFKDQVGPRQTGQGRAAQMIGEAGVQVDEEVAEEARPAVT